MGFDIPNLHLDESSPEGRVVREIVDREGLTPEDAVRDILRRVERSKTPAEQAWGLFSSPDDLAVFEEAMAFVKESRNAWQPHDLDFEA